LSERLAKRQTRAVITRPRAAVLKAVKPPAPRKLLLAAIAVAVLLAALLPAGTAAAHPLGNFTVNRYVRLELYEHALRLHYVLDFAEIPSARVVQEADGDGDRRLSQAELDAYLLRDRAEVLAGISLTVDGAPVELAHRSSLGQVLPGQAGLDIIRLSFVFDAPVAATAEAGVAFRDSNYEDRVGWKEIVVELSPGTRAAVAPEFLEDESRALLEYPSDLLNSAPEELEARFRWDPASGAPLPADVSIATVSAGRPAGGLASLLDREGSAGLALLALLIAFVLGAQHAIGPGHGKAMVASYLVGSRGRARHAIALGLTVTATHTATVYAMGFATLAAAEFVAPETLYQRLGVASGALVIAMGVALAVARLRAVVRGSAGSGEHRHGPFGRKHSHTAVQDHEHAHAHAHAADVSWRGLLTLGISGGLLPCPSAIVVMLAAISFGRILFGMALIVAFSLGLAFVLSAIGVALVVGRRVVERRGIGSALGSPIVARLSVVVPILSAFGVMAAGAYITYQAWNQPL
jgi:ABC-type nickel/cobalt efflux system permease component RcnA